MSLDTYVDRFLKSQERIASALEAIAVGMGETPKKAAGRPRKVETVPGAPEAGQEPAAGEVNLPGAVTAGAVAGATSAPQQAANVGGALADAKPATPMQTVSPPAGATATVTSVVDFATFKANVGLACSKGQAAKVTEVLKKYNAVKASEIPEDKRAAANAEILALIPATAA